MERADCYFLKHRKVLGGTFENHFLINLGNSAVLRGSKTLNLYDSRVCSIMSGDFAHKSYITLRGEANKIKVTELKVVALGGWEVRLNVSNKAVACFSADGGIKALDVAA
jgi:hypothetical protein